LIVTELPFDGERFIPGMDGALELEHIHRYALAKKLAAGKVVLDIASGEGYGSRMLADVAARVFGVDISEDAVAHARRTYRVPNLEFRAGSCAAIPLEDRSVDLVVSFETIEHHAQHEEMLDEIARVLKPDGVLFISSPNKHEYSDVPGFVNPFHVKELYLQQLTDLLARRFSSVAMLGQRQMHASTIAAMEPVPKSFEHFFSDLEPVAHDGLTRSIYFLAIATNGAIPELPNSVMEATLQGPEVLQTVLVPTSRFQAYWRVADEPYSEERSGWLTYPVGADVREYSVRLPIETGSVVDSLRIDFADKPLVCHLVLLDVCNTAGEVVWQWNRSDDTFDNASECFFVPSSADLRPMGQTATGLDIISTGIDPYFEIRLEDEQAARLGKGVLVRVRFATSRLLPSYQPDVLALMAELSTARREQAHLNAAALHTLSEMAEVVKQAQSRESEAREAAERSEQRADDAMAALARSEQRWARLQRHRWWKRLNGWFQLDHG
jgi:2-polyprenyl-3-methyl-5-hydroxy-6-metoxy-1,4-benzoquinol methylase